MTARERAHHMVHEYRILFMDSESEYGNEILVTHISKLCALVAAKMILQEVYINPMTRDYYEAVIEQINSFNL